MEYFYISPGGAKISRVASSVIIQAGSSDIDFDLFTLLNLSGTGVLAKNDQQAYLRNYTLRVDIE